jgi:hypothetical protein
MLIESVKYLYECCVWVIPYEILQFLRSPADVFSFEISLGIESEWIPGKNCREPDGDTIKTYFFLSFAEKNYTRPTSFFALFLLWQN